MDKIFINGFPNFSQNDDVLSIETFNFLGGEVHVKLHDKRVEPFTHVFTRVITIYARANNSDDIMRILLTNDALKRMGYEKIDLFIPYMPYARQDRVMVDGEPFSLKVFANMINSCGFNRVFVFDAHSDMVGGLIDNIHLITNSKFVELCIKEICLETGSVPVWACPDSGAYKKVFKLADAVGYKGEIILCNKARDLSTGKIASFTVDKNDLGGNNIIVNDDICSKGGTFMGLAKELKKRNAGKIYLIVSHYEGSADVRTLNDSGIERVYTTPSIGKVNSPPFVTEIPFTQFINFYNL